MKTTAILIAALLIMGCSNTEITPTTDKAAATPQSSPSVVPKKSDDEAALQRVGILAIESDLQVKISMAQLQAVMSGAKVEGNPGTMQDLWDVIGKRRTAVEHAYAEAIRQLPAGPLHEALKGCFTADIRFYDALTSVETTDGRRWLSTVNKAKDQRDEAASKLDVELRLARG